MALAPELGNSPLGPSWAIPFLAFGVVDNTKRVLDLSWSQDQRPDASSRVCVGSPARPWSVPWSVPGVSLECPCSSLEVQIAWNPLLNEVVSGLVPGVSLECFWSSPAAPNCMGFLTK